MPRKLEFDESLKEDGKGFVKALIIEAASCQTYFVSNKNQRNQSGASAAKPTAGNKNEDSNAKEKDKEPPICLLPA